MKYKTHIPIVILFVFVVISAALPAQGGLSDKQYRDKVEGAWLGKCIGGAFGLPMEGWHYTDIERKYGDNPDYMVYFSDGARDGWSGIARKIEIPKDGEWHHFNVGIITPGGSRPYYLVPIIGMSLEARTVPGSYTLKNLRILRPRCDLTSDGWTWLPMENCKWLLPSCEIQFDFDGQRAWTKMKSEVARKLCIRPGDTFMITLDAKWISGDCPVGIAFDYKMLTGRKGFGPDDDTTYEIIGLHSLETYGPDLSSKQIATEWVKHLGAPDSGTLAEEIARARIGKGIMPPESGKHPVGEAIGGQMKAEIWGLVCPGRPDLAAEYARRDGEVAHFDNGVYGEQFVAAMISASLYEKDVRKLIDIGLKHIPADSKYAGVVREVIAWHEKYPNWRDTVREVKTKYPQTCDPVYAEAGIVVLALLYGEGDFEKSIRIAACCGSDTDCNTATVGALMGCIKGAKGIPKYWKEPINDEFHCGVRRMADWRISDLAKHICAMGHKVMAYHGESMKFKSEEAEVSSYKIGNQYILRTVDVSGSRLVTKEIGRPNAPVSVIGGDEFALILGPDEKRITAGEFKISSVEPTADKLTVFLQHPGTGLKAEVEYCVNPDDFFMRKSISFKNESQSPIQIRDVEVESLKFSNARAITTGKPVYAEGQLFMGIEFPLGHNEQNKGLVTLGHSPGRTLKSGESLKTKTAVVGTASEKESAEKAFDRYVCRIALRKPEIMTVYGNWARYDYLSDTIYPDEKLVLETVDELAKMRKAGWQPDYYIMDAGWYDTTGDYTDYVKPAWPNGPEPMVKAINNLGIKYGLWFDVGGGIVSNPDMLPSKSSNGRLCLASEPYISTFKNALLNQIEDLGLTMVKFDFATFACDSDKHGHLLDKYAGEATMTGFLDMLDSVRKEHPQVKYIIFNGFYRSPWWLMHVDTIYTNDPAPSDTPSLRLRDSINLQTDSRVHAHRFDHLLPWYAIDDCGLMIGKAGTIYWIGAEEFRKTWVMNIGRGGMMPFIYGDLRLLDDSDRRFIVKMWNVLRENAEVFANTKAILGKPNGEEVYGYSHFKGNHGFVFLNNPTFEQKSVTLGLDFSIGLDVGPQNMFAVSELFPVECNYAGIMDRNFHKPGEEIKIELAPFEVRTLEIKPTNGSIESAVPPRQSNRKSIPIPVHAAKKEPAWVTDAMIDMTNNELSHLAASTTAKVEKPGDITRPALDAVYSFTIELPKFGESQTLAMPIRFMRDGKPAKENRPTSCVLAAAWTGNNQILLDVTPEYGRNIWSRCSWLTFHTKLDPTLSGKKIEVLVLNLGLKDAGLDIDKVYLLDTQ